MTERLESKQFAASRVEFKDAQDGQHGTMRLYFSAFGNWDDERPIPDMVMPGAASKYLPQLVKSGFSSWNHNWREGALPVGTISAAGEDDYGTWADIEFHSHPDAQAAYTVAKERHARGKDVVGSMTYLTHSQKMADITDPDLLSKGVTRGRQLMDVEPVEVGLVSIPANSKAIMTSVKTRADDRSQAERSVEYKAMFEDTLADQTNDFWNLVNVLCQVLCNIDDMDESAEDLGMPFDYEGNLWSAMTEFSARVVQARVDADAEEDRDEQQQSSMDNMMVSDAAKSRSLGNGRGYGAYLQAVDDAVSMLVTRTKARRELRVKEGRMFSAQNIDKLGTMADTVDEHGKAMQQHASDLRALVAGSQKPNGGNDVEGEQQKRRRLVAEAIETLALTTTILSS